VNRRRLLALLVSVVVAATAAYAGTSVTFNGTSYTIPAVGDAAWGTNVSNYLIALSTGTLQKTGGSFTLTNDVNFGATYGLISSYFKSRSANPATGGAVRLSNTDTIEWRNSGNTGEIALSATSGALTVNGVGLVDLSSAQTLTNKTLTQPIIATISNSGVLTLPATTDTLVGRATTDTLTNKTLTSPVISSISNSGTLTLPTGPDTLVGRATTDTLTNKTLTSPVISSISNSGTITLPTGTRTLVARDTTDTLTNKTLTSPTITGMSSTAVSSLGLRDTSAAFDVTLAATSSTNLTAGRTLTIDMQNAAYTWKAAPLSNFSTLADGSNGQVLTTTGSGVGYVWTSPLVNPMTTAGDLILGGSAGAAGRLAIGSTNGNVLTVSAGAVTWGKVNLASSGAVTGTLADGNLPSTMSAKTFSGLVDASSSSGGLKVESARSSPAVGDSQNVYSGTYSVTPGNVANVTPGSAATINWVRVGQMVTVSGVFVIGTTGSAYNQFSITLPIPPTSNFGVGQFGGAGVGNDGGTTVTEVWQIVANAGSKVALFRAPITNTAASDTVAFTFTYPST